MQRLRAKQRNQQSNRDVDGHEHSGCCGKYQPRDSSAVVKVAKCREDNLEGLSTSATTSKSRPLQQQMTTVVTTVREKLGTAIVLHLSSDSLDMAWQSEQVDGGSATSMKSSLQFIFLDIRAAFDG